MPRRLSEHFRTAFVTGAGSGLGKAFAEMLAGEGLRVWGTSRDPKRVSGSAGIMPVTLDLGDGAACVAAFEGASREAGGGFDVVVNNAGYGVFGEFAANDFEVWRLQLEAMLVSTLRVAHAAWRTMIERDRGSLVNISSLAAEFPLPYMSGYNVCKSGLSAFSESLAFESRGSAVKVIDFRPGDYRTAFNDHMTTAPASPLASPRLAAAWRVLESNLAAAPGPERAAADLRLALLRGSSGIVRSGSFFQARLAPLLARAAPSAAVRAATARYFGSA